MSFSVFEMHSVELFCYRPLGARYVICDEWHYNACLKKAADLTKAKAQTQEFLGIAGLNSWDGARDRNFHASQPTQRRPIQGIEDSDAPSAV
jgi:hypothetical protein